MAFIENIPEEAFETLSWANVSTVTKTPTKSSVSASIKSEEAEEKNVKREELKKWLSDRAAARKNIFTGRMSSWNKWLDNAEIRKGRITDLARWALEEMWKDPEAIKRISDDDLIKRLVWWVSWTDMKKLNAVNGYMQNWWYAQEVFDYLVGAKEEKEPKSTIRNIVWSTLSTPIESIAWLSDIVQKNIKYGWKTIYDINKEADIAWLWELIWWISEEEYQKYKKEWSKRYEKAFNTGIEWYYNIWDIKLPWVEWAGSQYISRADFYKSYDDAVKQWFDWNVEQYWQYLYNKGVNTYNSAAEKVRNYLQTEVYDPKWKWSWVGKFLGEMIEWFALPETKVKYLKYTPEVTKWTKNLIKATNLLKGSWKLWLEWVKLQALEDAYDAEVSSLWKYATTATRNALLWWFIKWVGNALWWPKWLAKTAIWTKTQSEWNEMTNITKNSFANANAEVTPYTKVRDILVKAKDRLLKDRLSKWWELWETRAFDIKYKPWVKYTAKEALEQDINKSLMEQASKKRFGNLAWKRDLVPQFKITKNWLEVSNPDVLNNISKNENWAVVKLWDKIKSAYSETFWAWAPKNAATTEKFLRRLDNVFGEEWWSGWPENFINLMKEWIKNATEKFEGSLTEETLSKLKSTRAADKEAIQLDNTFNKIIWRLDWVEWVWAAEKATKNTVTIQELFKKVLEATSKDWKWAIDLNNEIWAWIANLSIYDAKAAQKLLENIYPSQPWAMEFIIKSILWSMKRKWAVKATKDYSPSMLWKIWENIWWVVSSQM